MSADGRRWLAAVALGFCLVLVARFPARWAAPLLPKSVICRELSGSVWSGECAGLSLDHSLIGDTRWELQVAPLLRAALGGTLALAQPRAQLATSFMVRAGGDWTLRDLKSDFLLDRALYRNLPQGLAGRVVTDLPTVEFAKGRVRALRGRLELRDVVQVGAPPLQVGSYEVRFDSPPQPNGDIVGVVRDLGGPIAFDGTLKLTSAGRYVLDGRVATRPGAAVDLAQRLEILGHPDADGRRPLSFDASF